MPDFPNRKGWDRSRLDSMEDEQLQQILREDASKPEGEESDLEMILCVMEILSKRRQERNEGKSPEEAWDSFRKNYDPGNAASEAAKNTVKRGAGGRRWVRGLTAAAAALAIIVCCTFTAKGFGVDVWQIIAKWTQETFHFGYADPTVESNQPEKEDTTAYSDLKELLEQNKINEALVPSWLPDGYEAVDLEVNDTPMQRHFTAIYLSGENMIQIQIKDFLDDYPEQVEQSEGLEEIYKSGEVEYYIFSNNGLIRAVWTVGHYECYISGPLTISEIKEMIDSI